MKAKSEATSMIIIIISVSLAAGHYTPEIQMLAERVGSQGSPSTSSSAQPCPDLTEGTQTVDSHVRRCVSGYCLRGGAHCRWPSCVNGAGFHATSHHAYAQAELTRPYPLGFLAECPASPPTLDDADLHASHEQLEQEFFCPAPVRKAQECHASVSVSAE